MLFDAYDIVYEENMPAILKLQLLLIVPAVQRCAVIIEEKTNGKVIVRCMKIK